MWARPMQLPSAKMDNSSHQVPLISTQQLYSTPSSHPFPHLLLPSTSSLIYSSPLPLPSSTPPLYLFPHVSFSTHNVCCSGISDVSMYRFFPLGLLLHSVISYRVSYYHFYHCYPYRYHDCLLTRSNPSLNLFYTSNIGGADQMVMVWRANLMGAVIEPTPYPIASDQSKPYRSSRCESHTN